MTVTNRDIVSVGHDVGGRDRRDTPIGGCHAVTVGTPADGVRLPDNDSPLAAANDHSPGHGPNELGAAFEAWRTRETRSDFRKLRVNQADREVWKILEGLLETHDLSSTIRAALVLALDYLARNPVEARRLIRQLEAFAGSGVRKDPRRKHP